MARRSNAALLTLAVASVHVGVLTFVVTHARAPARLAAAPASPHRWVVARALAPADADRDSPALAAPKAPSDRPPEPHPPISATAPRQVAATTPPAGDGVAPAAADTQATPATRFYGYDEVETPASPTDDWSIDVHALDMLALSRIVVTLYVDDAGTIVRCTVDEPARLTTAEREALAERIARTPLQPARRGGVPVASKRRIELTSHDSG